MVSDRTKLGLTAARATVAASALALCALIAAHTTGGAATGPSRKPPAAFDLKDALLNDPASPVAGNPNGDVTIVAFVDYNCPYCKRSDGDLSALIASDPQVRVVYKDWPILAKSSLTAAKVAIAAKWQDKYAAVHEALMRMSARPATDQAISQAVIASGIDVAKLNRDLDQRDDEIVDLIKRNIAEADALGLRGTPVYVVGPYIEASALDAAGFKQIVSEARQTATRPAADTR